MNTATQFQEGRRVKLLFVCMGNICRSPTAKGVFDDSLSEVGAKFESDSAGTHAYHVGEAPDPRAVYMALSRGIDISGDRARRVCEEDFQRFDVIYAMDRDNLAILERMKPPGCRARVELVMSLAPDYGLDEVPDPYYGGDEGFRRVLDMLETAAENLGRELSWSKVQV